MLESNQPNASIPNGVTHLESDRRVLDPGARLERASSSFKAKLSWPVDDPGVVTRGLEPQPPAL